MGRNISKKRWSCIRCWLHRLLLQRTEKQVEPFPVDETGRASSSTSLPLPDSSNNTNGHKLSIAPSAVRHAPIGINTTKSRVIPRKGKLVQDLEKTMFGAAESKQSNIEYYRQVDYQYNHENSSRCWVEPIQVIADGWKEGLALNHPSTRSVSQDLLLDRTRSRLPDKHSISTYVENARSRVHALGDKVPEDSNSNTTCFVLPGEIPEVPQIYSEREEVRGTRPCVIRRMRRNPLFNRLSGPMLINQIGSLQSVNKNADKLVLLDLEEPEYTSD